MGTVELYNSHLDKIERIRVVYRTNTRRVILPINSIPGQPKFNYDIKNLANLKIPYVRFDNSWSMRNAIKKLLHTNGIIEQTPRNRAKIALTFPRSYTNVTAGELLKDWASQFPGCRVYIDEEKGRIEIRPPKTLGQRFKAIMRKIERMTGL